jgi:hypothetical protein
MRVERVEEHGLLYFVYLLCLLLFLYLLLVHLLHLLLILGRRTSGLLRSIHRSCTTVAVAIAIAIAIAVAIAIAIAIAIAVAVAVAVAVVFGYGWPVLHYRYTKMLPFRQSMRTKLAQVFTTSMVWFSQASVLV